MNNLEKYVSLYKKEILVVIFTIKNQIMWKGNF